MSKPSPSERRGFGRRSDHMHALAIVPGRDPRHCMISNFSPKGALLVFHETPVLPLVFKLGVVCRHQHQELTCLLRHRNDKAVGVEFVGDAPRKLIAAMGEEQSDTRQPNHKEAQSMTDGLPRRTAASQVRETVLGSSGSELPRDLRPLDLVPGRVIRGV